MSSTRIDMRSSSSGTVVGASVPDSRRALRGTVTDPPRYARQRTASSRTSPPLAPVPEDQASLARRPAHIPSTTFHSKQSTGQSHTRGGMVKGKERVHSDVPATAQRVASAQPQAAQQAHTYSPSTSNSTSPRHGRTPWVVDVTEARHGAEVWDSADRVILVLGEPSASSLAPLLYSPSFANTLILIGSTKLLPDIEALLSPSHLLHAADDRTVYPNIQPFSPPASVIAAAAHPLPAFLHHGAALADAYRRSGGANPTPRRSSWVRRGSSDSGSGSGIESLTPPHTPPRSRFSLQFNRSSSSSSLASMSAAASVTDLARYSSSSSRSVMGSDRQGSSRPGSKRMSTWLSSKENDPRGGDASPFDAVLNFIPSASALGTAHAYDTQRILQEMLHQTVVLTSALLPLFAARTISSATSTPSVADVDLSPLTVLHVVPADAPQALAPVVERFLLPLLPTMAQRIRRDLFGAVTNLSVWLASRTERSPDALSGAETLLFGGVRCPTNYGAEMKPQACITGWEQCIPMPGAFQASIARTQLKTPNAQPTSTQSMLPPTPPSSTGTTTPPELGDPLTIEDRWGAAPVLPSPVGVAADSRKARFNSDRKSRSDFSSIAYTDTAPRLLPALSMSSAPYTPRSLAATSPSSGSGSGSSSQPRPPSNLRHAVATAPDPTPPTPELDPSSSSCSSSSVSGVGSSVTEPTQDVRVLAPVAMKAEPHKSGGIMSWFKRSRGLRT